MEIDDEMVIEDDNISDDNDEEEQDDVWITFNPLINQTFNSSWNFLMKRFIKLVFYFMFLIEVRAEELAELSVLKYVAIQRIKNLLFW